MTHGQRATLMRGSAPSRTTQNKLAQNKLAHGGLETTAMHSGFARFAETLAVKEGPDNLCNTRRTIQPERTIIRSNL